MPCWPPKVLGTSQRGPQPRAPLLLLAWRSGVRTLSWLGPQGWAQRAEEV